jgi:hypothetical protein
MGDMNAGTNAVLKGKAGEETQGAMTTAKLRLRQGKAVNKGGKKEKATKAKYAPPHLFFQLSLLIYNLISTSRKTSMQRIREDMVSEAVGELTKLTPFVFSSFFLLFLLLTTSFITRTECCLEDSGTSVAPPE